MERRCKRHRWRFGAVVAALVVVAACSDDDAGDTTEVTVESAVPDTTEAPPETTAPPATTTTSTTLTVPPSTTMSVEDLKAQIAADYQRSWQLRRELTENPTLDGLDEKLAQISAPGSADEATIRTFVNELVTLGERVVPGNPDEFRIDVERVDLAGDPPYQQAVVTICFVGNSVRVDGSGAVVADVGIIATRSEEHLVPTPAGWLPDQGMVDTWQGLGATQCPPA